MPSCSEHHKTAYNAVFYCMFCSNFNMYPFILTDKTTIYTEPQHL